MGYTLPSNTGYVSADYWNHVNRNPPSSEPGTDYGSAYGSPCYAVGDGFVTAVKNSNSGAMGRTIEIALDDGRSDRPLHLSAIYVQPGWRVTEGAIIGLTGASGYGADWYYGAHVHQTLWPGSIWSAPTIDFEPHVSADAPHTEPPPEEEMPITETEMRKIAQAVWSYEMGGGDPDNDPNAVPTETGGERLRQIRRSSNGLKGRTEKILDDTTELTGWLPESDDIVVSVIAARPGFEVLRSETHAAIPPDYEAVDVAQLFAVTVENAADHLLRLNGYRRPRMQALLGNAARMSRLEAVLDEDGDSIPDTVRALLREIIDIDAEDAIRRWGTEPVE